MYKLADHMNNAIVGTAAILIAAPIFGQSLAGVSLEGGIKEIAWQAGKSAFQDLCTQFASNYTLNGNNFEDAWKQIDIANAAITGLVKPLKYNTKTTEVVMKAIIEFTKTTFDLSVKRGGDLKYSGDDSYVTELVTRQLMALIPKVDGLDTYGKYAEDFYKKSIRSLVHQAVLFLRGQESEKNEGNVQTEKTSKE